MESLGVRRIAKRPYGQTSKLQRRIVYHMRLSKNKEFLYPGAAVSSRLPAPCAGDYIRQVTPRVPPC
jgi:hypothetical protein